MFYQEHHYLPKQHMYTLNTMFSIMWYLMSPMVTFWMPHIMNKWNNYWSWMMDEFIHWPKPYLLLSTTCDEMLPWMTEVWMRNHLVRSDSYCNTVTL